MAELLPYAWQQASFEQCVTLHQSQRLAHALLVQGEKGIGKRRWVDALAQTVLCQDAKDYACGHCKACQLFSAGSHPDFVTIELLEKSAQIKIDQIREAGEFLSKTSQMQGMKVIVIEPAETMNINAANALLKNLEEPADKTLIILLSHQPQRLLPTIRSRCQTIALSKPSENDAEQWLSTFVNDATKRQQLLELAMGNPLRALDFYERDMLSLHHRLLQDRLAYSIGQGNTLQAANQLKEFAITDVLSMQQQLLWQMIQHAMKIENITLPEPLSNAAKKTSFAEKAYALLEFLQKSSDDIQRNNPNEQLLLEAIEVRWQALLRLP